MTESSNHGNREGSVVRLAVCLTHDGCGSANIHFFKTLQEAESYEEAEFESSGERWGEPTYRMLTLVFNEEGELTNGQGPHWSLNDK